MHYRGPVYDLETASSYYFVGNGVISSNCACRCEPVPPNATAEPFVDFRKEVEALPEDQRKRVMGANAYKLVQSGAVDWTDVVTRSRIRPLHEILQRAKLPDAVLRKAGLSRATIDRAAARVNTPARQAQLVAAKTALERLRALGLTEAQIREQIAGRVLGRLGIAGPSGPGAVTPRTPPAPPPKPARTFGPSEAKVAFARDNEPTARRILADLLGPEATPQDVASLVGAPRGARVEVLGLAVPGKGASLAVRTDFAFRAGYTERRIVRDPEGRLVVKNDSFFLAPGAGGQGLGTEVLGRQVEHAARLGVAYLETYAAGAPSLPKVNGYHVWPRLGFDGPLMRGMREKLATAPGVPAAIRGATRVSEVMATPEGRAWWRDNGADMSLRFDLAEGSYSRRAFAAYLEEREAR